MGKLTGVILLLLSSPSLPNATKQPQYLEYEPAAHPVEDKPASYRECFEEQVELLVGRVAASATQRSVLDVMLRNVEATLRTVWPGCKVKLFGSLTTGLGAGGSDVDFTVFLPHEQHGDFIALATAAFRADTQIYHNIHTRARLPAITFQYKHSIKCDVNFKNEGTFESELLNHLLTLDDRAFKLAHIIKHWAKLHKLIRPKYLTSYGMMMMVIFYLQQISILPSVLELQLDCPALILNSTSNFNVAFCRKYVPSRNNESLFQILGGFFKFYENFDFNKWIISPYTGRVVQKILFKELKTVPKEFKQYKINVANNLIEPLNVTGICAQSLLMLNDNCAWRVGNASEFVPYFRSGAKSLRCSNKCMFLKAIGVDVSRFFL